MLRLPHVEGRVAAAASVWATNSTRIASEQIVLLRLEAKKKQYNDEQQSRKCISIIQENGLNKARKMKGETERARENEWVSGRKENARAAIVNEKSKQT